MAEQVATTEQATLAGGCFWCVESVIQRLVGVQSIKSGYTGGTVANPTYKQVCEGNTGHAEVVHVTFDPAQLSYYDLLQVFFYVHDPTQLNRQGEDVGTQYRSAVFYHSEQQKATALQVIDEITKSGRLSAPIVTEVTPFSVLYDAEDYHQDYFNRNPTQGFCVAVIPPKLRKLYKTYGNKVQDKYKEKDPEDYKH